MKNLDFINLMKEKGISRKDLAEKIFISESVIWNWEQGNAKPTIERIVEMARILGMDAKDIRIMFEPQKTNVEKNNEEKTQMYNLLTELFLESDNTEYFIKLAHIFSITNLHGVVSCADDIFPFTKTFADSDGTAVVISDNFDNYIVLTATNIIKVEPVTSNFGIFTFNITVCCPLFPIEEKYSPSNFRQQIRISFFSKED